MERLRGFARNADITSNSPRVSSGSIFDMSALSETLEAAEPAPVSTPVQVNPSMRRRSGPVTNRNEQEKARDFEVGFLGEQFVSLTCYIQLGYKLILL